MKSTWLHQGRGRQELIIFCNGWGMDGTPFQPLGAEKVDVLMFSDYVDLLPDREIAPLFQHYRAVSLVSWSMGVWAGQQLFTPWSNRLRRALAINGTLCPVHDQFGIPLSVFNATREQFSAAARLKFYRRMCRNGRDRRGGNVLETFIANQPQRSLENQARELGALSNTAGYLPTSNSIYSDIVIGDQDLIMPTVNQEAFWCGHGYGPGRNVRLVEGTHFLFYEWKSWDALLDALL